MSSAYRVNLLNAFYSRDRSAVPDLAVSAQSVTFGLNRHLVAPSSCSHPHRLRVACALLLYRTPQALHNAFAVAHLGLLESLSTHLSGLHRPP